jgi:peptidyl-prolyl cis-trans isomerase-like 6
MPILHITGDMLDWSFQLARHVAEDLVSSDPTLEIEVKGLVEADWRKYASLLRRQLGGKAFSHGHEAIATHSTIGYIGGVEELISWASHKYNYRDPGAAVRAALIPTMRAMGEEQLANYVASSHNQFAFFEFGIGANSVADSKDSLIHNNRVVFELYRRQCPKTCANFLALCAGDHKGSNGQPLGYRNTIIHRVVRGGWISGGDVIDGKGNHGESIYGPTFADECLSIKHDSIGTLSMANNGPHTNGSQFFIALQSLPSLDTKKVVFGRVISGLTVLERINDVDTRNERPREAVTITSCGIFDPVAAKGPGKDLIAAWTAGAGRNSDALRRALRDEANDSKRHHVGPTVTPTRSATILVIGLDGAGKTTMVNHFLRTPAEHVMPTHGFEPSECVQDGMHTYIPTSSCSSYCVVTASNLFASVSLSIEYNLTFFGLGGGGKFRGIWPQYFGAAHGFIYVIDASDESREEETTKAFAEIVSHDQVKGKPICVFANKQVLIIVSPFHFISVVVLLIVDLPTDVTACVD